MAGNPGDFWRGAGLFLLPWQDRLAGATLFNAPGVQCQFVCLAVYRHRSVPQFGESVRTGREKLTASGNSFKTIEWTAEGVVLIDQRVLPRREEYLVCRSYLEVAEAIRTMVVRGAPAIGVAAAMGIALGVQQSQAAAPEALQAEFKLICDTLAATRPTGYNLFWAIARMKTVFQQMLAAGADLALIQARLRQEAQTILEEDISANKAMGDYGASLIPTSRTVMTVCNAGALATAGYGTALGVIRSAIRQGKKVDVMALETRPFLQGARLTAWELMKDGIPTTLVTDNMAGYYLHSGRVGCVVVGADRIAANGDVANKIGTYSAAVLAKENGVPFYVAAPLSTIDLSIASGEAIPIEQRPASEVLEIQGVAIAPQGVAVCNPAFDVTPHAYVSAIITERGVAIPPYTETLQRLKKL
ncbi:MAG: S-methyl-5-thioribose-1-phosphate isomerase [Acidobacteria bacterium]|nr:S-methyl-5-thioribose-1-phosphate isomerase [Acidobacteriota bacterium]